MAGALERYQKLQIRDSLSLSHRYPMACKELAVILRLAYSKSPKPLQSLLLEDTITAFRTLPSYVFGFLDVQLCEYYNQNCCARMRTQSAVSAANLLFQSAEAALPKQKRVLAAAEFKQAKIAHKRHGKCHQDDKDLIQLPQDVLVYLFSFLDMQSLASAGLVCRSWNVAANDNYLWQLHYTNHFGDSNSFLKVEGLQSGPSTEDRQYAYSGGVCADANLDWKDVFRRAYLGLPSWRYKFSRGYCGRCDSIVWLNNLKCPNQHSEQRAENQQLRPVSPSQIVRYIVDEDSPWLMYFSDSDSDSDEELGFRFWSFIRH